jgi:hypothetical protein
MTVAHDRGRAGASTFSRVEAQNGMDRRCSVYCGLSVWVRQREQEVEDRRRVVEAGAVQVA